MAQNSTKTLLQENFDSIIYLLGSGLLLLVSITYPAIVRAEQSRYSCADAVIIGKVVGETYSELPIDRVYVNMDVSWSLRVKVKRVLFGSISNDEIVVLAVANAAPREDRPITFHLKYKDGIEYKWLQWPGDCK